MTLPDWAHEISSALDEKMGFELFELSAQRTTGRMPVAGAEPMPETKVTENRHAYLSWK